MGWREFQAWVVERNLQIDRLNQQQATDPDSWDGREHDGFWQRADARRRAERGH